jgi:hypothetical protein
MDCHHACAAGLRTGLLDYSCRRQNHDSMTKTLDFIEDKVYGHNFRSFQYSNNHASVAVPASSSFAHAYGFAMQDARNISDERTPRA